MVDKTIVIADVVDGVTTTAEGIVLYREIAKIIDAGDRVILSFKDVKPSTRFLQSSIGKLYGMYPWDKLAAVMLEPKHIDGSTLEVVAMVVNNAKHFFRDRKPSVKDK